ncbi:NAD(P)/FAD-dependent oxidoreductase [Nocardia uniformis]|uniref:NAD(P)/FAD-dependent oxidoreductase n=1 Tax=Nocardia uniformis TaxID=53432 RepID=A0A849C2E0_9NOCA|nr:NAD(P)/FAD-dependent oxidoreductase [Nocardia uniformis]NNH70600.1 NAD(P)/FAD-dependent oxidoreductase [Nocardia uniformis]
MKSVIVVGAGQSGIAAAGALSASGWQPVLLESGADAAGSWPHYYDSLRLFTPSHFNTIAGRKFPGDPNRYPSGTEMADYLRAAAAELDCAIHTGARVSAVAYEAGEYRVRTHQGGEFTGAAVVACTGSFTNPYRPKLPGLVGYTGRVLHASEYRCPTPFIGKRVVVVGAGNSAVQIAVELAEHAEVTLTSRSVVRYATNQPVPAESRLWTVLAAAARLPFGPLVDHGTVPVLDIGGHRDAIESGRPNHRDLFVGASGSSLDWASGEREHVDAVILATGYRPALDYLEPLGALDAHGAPHQRFGLSRTHRGLGFVGLEYQRTILSATVHGVGRDARYVARRLTRRVAGASRPSWDRDRTP